MTTSVTKSDWFALKIFISTAPAQFESNRSIDIKSHQLPNSDRISCILYDSIFYITSTDIFKILHFRLEMIGKAIPSHLLKKFEEWVFSDLRRLKEERDWTIKESNSPLLEFLVVKRAVKKSKKQKIYHWWSVPHEDLFNSIVFRLVKMNAPSHCTERDISQMMRDGDELRLLKEQGSIMIQDINDL